jgi:crotonobetainyl-CoA:carnitine CoA-transferase CaiB-like acyl-CoA transferase
LNARVRAPAQLEIYKILEEWAADKSRSEVVKVLKDAGILAAPVKNDKEVYESEHLRERGTIRWLDDPTFGDVLLQSGYSSGMMSETPRRVNWIWRPVGADNMKIYHEMLGYTPAKIEEWYNKGMI